MTSKHVPLSDEEIKALRLRAQVLQSISRAVESRDIQRSNVRILDWGCGRGSTVIKLLEMGFDAYGVDIDPKPLMNGVDAFRARGQDSDLRLRLISPGSPVPFPDGFFHVVLSDQVFEHVRDLDQMVSDLRRVTMPGGLGLHFFPAKWRIVEPHLHVPLVHWLPKNAARRVYIRSMLHRIPEWKGMATQSAEQRVQVYYDYSVQKTYYRPLKCIQKALEREGFVVDCEAPPTRMPRLLRWAGPLGQRAVASWHNHFHEVALTTRLPASV